MSKYHVNSIHPETIDAWKHGRFYRYFRFYFISRKLLLVVIDVISRDENPGHSLEGSTICKMRSQWYPEDLNMQGYNPFRLWQFSDRLPSLKSKLKFISLEIQLNFNAITHTVENVWPLRQEARKRPGKLHRFRHQDISKHRIGSEKK